MIGRLSLALVVASILVGCSPAADDPVVADGSVLGGDPVVDTWPVGPEVACTPDRHCPALLATATIGFDRRDPGHPAVVGAVLHEEGTMVNAKGERILITRSGGCCVVARFELADGSVAAIGVGYPGVSTIPMAFDEGP